MQRRAFLSFPPLLAALALPVGPPAARAQGAPEKVRFDSVDQVELRGTYYPSGRWKKAPCALLLHDLGGQGRSDDWDPLARQLQGQGFAVLRFDFRGHGASTAVAEEFWHVRTNQLLVKGFHPSRPKETIRHEDFHRSYFPALVNDIAAARLFLDRRNDAGECNSANLVLVGAGEGATLGALWLAAEGYRYQLVGSTFQHKLARSPEGANVIAAVWLTISPEIQNTPVPLFDWLRLAGRDGKLPMAFLHGERDRAGAAVARRGLEAVQAGGDDRLTATRAVRGTAEAGPALLRDGLDTRDLIVHYAAHVYDKQGETEWNVRDVNQTGYVWAFPRTRPVVAKLQGEKTLRWLPVEYLGVR